MRRPPGSAAAAALENDCGSEPTLATFSRVLPPEVLPWPVVVVSGVALPPLPQPPARNAAAARAVSPRLCTQVNLTDYAGSVLVRRPVRSDRSPAAVCEPAAPAETRATDVRH